MQGKSHACQKFARQGFLRMSVEPRVGVVERAFEIAKSGDASNIMELRTALAKEGYSNVAQIFAGRSLKLQLMRMITDVRTAKGKP
jgi:hypothetical protein